MKHMYKYILLITVIFSGCVTAGDIFLDVHGHRSRSERRLAEIEAAIIPLEAVGGTEARRRQNEMSSARLLITNTERDASADPEFLGKLIAWSGRLSILEGRYSEAIRLHRQSSSIMPGNIPAIILEIRLEGNPTARLELIERELVIHGGMRHQPGLGELNIERGSTLIELNRFGEAAGAFDIAFSLGLDNVTKKVTQQSETEHGNLEIPQVLEQGHLVCLFAKPSVGVTA